MKVTVNTSWLNNNLYKNNLIIIDSSWYMPSQNIDCYNNYLKQHIPGSVFIDIDNLSEKKSDLPHMIPGQNKFENYMKLIGVNKNSIVIIYDSQGIFSSPRLWWMFKYFGFNKVYILDGGLKKWKKEKRILTNKKTKNKYGNFVTEKKCNLLSKKNEVLRSIYDDNIKIIDVRSKNRFLGKEKEPRKGLRSGRIPNSKNLYWRKLINYDGTIKKNNDLIRLLKKYELRKNTKIISTCGSGITACILNLSLAMLNFSNISVYDGSWAEWASQKNLPIK